MRSELPLTRENILLAVEIAQQPQQPAQAMRDAAQVGVLAKHLLQHGQDAP